jgi:hypothetical protein
MEIEIPLLFVAEVRCLRGRFWARTHQSPGGGTALLACARGGVRCRISCGQVEPIHLMHHARHIYMLEL